MTASDCNTTNLDLNPNPENKLFLFGRSGNIYARGFGLGNSNILQHLIFSFLLSAALSFVSASRTRRKVENGRVLMENRVFQHEIVSAYPTMCGIQREAKKNNKTFTTLHFN